MEFSQAYSVLRKVYGEGAYVSEVITRDKVEDGFSVRLSYGVIERDYELSEIISALCVRAPKQPVKIILKMATYCLRYMDSLPSYAVINEAVNFAKKIGKGENAGFINAVLKKSIDFVYDDGADLIKRIAFNTSTPVWIVNKLVNKFGADEAEKLLRYREERATLRFNGRLITEEEGLKMLDRLGVTYEKIALGGYRVSEVEKLKNVFKRGEITYQSPSSQHVARVASLSSPKNVLDLCSAPGGKAVYVAELTGASVTACDIHPHRVELIKKYAERMKAQGITAQVMDGTKRCEQYVEKFDLVLVDAPCSGIGVMHSKPEVALNRKESDVKTLQGVQLKLLETACDYVTRGGYLLYSTCTLLDEENCEVVDKFLLRHGDFILDMPDGSNSGEEILPHVHGSDGFYLARMRKI